ncbi:uncharacterized protein Z520_08884 [Fonsecaea multimorphosa CBS 102226]|uniref:Trafficking protein particle complex subunit 11 domain-containing protein n=1 Tax=Fonsecaea multimorphosa CBS 102226 TaxID=1442371 RepID=A0A0D2JPT1_9EURO|nr:uncharacterized protein Z520_08884 [Fonsecaea multimorphosa CBS 102226]KIX95367.1 hypothetical protein Z520_08884 [Fonsecaea multimorphosa CBS 102226]OAL21035.1 hypothetical protein AYO22_08319 [Fonsecaea multimorphosa]
MDRFPQDYVLHNLPLLLLSGLNTRSPSEPDALGKTHEFLHEGGFRIKVDAPVVSGPLAEQLLQSFCEQDASDVPWHSQYSTARNGRIFKIVKVGRVYTLPPRKAPPPPHSPRLSAVDANGSPPPALVLHSPLSPLTPSSPLYPDGIISPLWITKHQSRLPCALLTIFTLGSDPNTSSLHDNKLKSEINNVRSVLTSANYKTRLVVILLGDGIISPSDLEERFSTIRRATGLDGKSIYFLAHNSSPAEVTAFVSSVLSSLHPICVEYYRDLSKHARRKRNRSAAPQPTVQPGSSHILSLQGWNVRYEFKLGVFAEFRQEMDAACRNYETAYDNLFAAEIIDAIAVWSPRFNEARLLADGIAFRTIRCLLWTDQVTTAVRSWVAHRDRIRDLVDRRGKGTNNYSWEAWQTAWAKIMADLVSRSEYPLLHLELPNTPGLLPIFADVDKSLSTGERIAPWEQLHHEGYWLEIAKRCIHARRNWALQIPEEDRQSPGRSPASMVASKAHLYDTYLALEPYREFPADGSPGYDYVGEIISTLDAAISHFAKRGQLRKIEALELQKAFQQIQAESWAEAVTTLRQLWHNQYWRHAGWWKLLQGLGWALLDCLAHVQDGELLAQLIWELSNQVFRQKPNTNYDLRRGIIPSSNNDGVLSVAVGIDEALSPLVATFSFSTHDVFVGEPVECQLCIQSRAQIGLPAIRLSEIKVVFEGSLKPVHLVAKEGEDSSAATPTAQFIDVRLDDSSTMSLSSIRRSSAGAIAAQISSADLTIPPDHTKIFRLRVIPREAGEISVASITLMINDETLNFAATSTDFSHSIGQWWESKAGTPMPRSLGQESNAFNKINVQPKPPKLKIEAPGLRRSYYTNESITIVFEILNEEAEDAIASLDARMISPVEGAAQMMWVGTGLKTAPAAASGPGLLTLEHRELGTIPSSEKAVVSLRITDTAAAVDHEVELLATYRLNSEPETILTKTLTVDVGVIRPFEANYDFIPQLDKEPWPNFFEAPPQHSDSLTPLGLRHLYSVGASLYSFAAEPLVIEAILLTATKIVGGAVCSASTGIVRKTAETGAATKDSDATISTVIKPDHTETFDFDLTLQKLVLGDRHTVAVELALEIGWRRQDSEEVSTTLLEVPRLVAPMAEPRVMLTVSSTSLGPLNIEAYKLSFTIENPSMHYLTFNVSMEASEDFAFSGSKACAISLVPISRQTLNYRILPNKKDEWIAVHMNVVDAYFGQTLRVLAGGSGVKVDKKGNVLVKV